MKVGRAVSIAAICIAASGCYHQVVQTGKTPGPTVIDKPWVHTFIFGLVAPPPIDVSAQCTRGIATVVTEASFVNGLVGFITFGLYMPRHATITCAASNIRSGGTLEIYVDKGASSDELGKALARAAEESARQQQPVNVHF